jgi:restriction system protein
VIGNALLNPILANWPGFAVLLGFNVLFKFLASPTIKGRIGEATVNFAVLNKLDPKLYRHFHDLHLPHPDGHGTTQIDHVVVSPFGIFVIETKNYKGWIFGSEKQREWTQQIYRRKNRFQNPLHQNALHVRSLMAFLGLPGKYFRPVVCFSGDAEFKTPMPDNVLNRGLRSWIDQHTVAVLDANAWQQAGSRLDELSRSTDRREAARNHLAILKSRHAA